MRSTSVCYFYGKFSVFCRGLASILLFLSAASFSGCTSLPDGASVSIPPDPQDDEQYARVLNRWKKELIIFDRFQNRLELHSVLFTEDMRQAYLNRWVKMRGDSFAKIGMDVGGKLAMFVSVFTPEEDYQRIDDSSLWTVRLTYGERVLKPTIIRQLYEKSMYSSFFNFVNNWTSEYLIVFDVSVSDSVDSMVLPSVVSAQFLSSLASLELQWK